MYLWSLIWCHGSSNKDMILENIGIWHIGRIISFSAIISTKTVGYLLFTFFVPPHIPPFQWDEKSAPHFLTEWCLNMLIFEILLCCWICLLSITCKIFPDFEKSTKYLYGSNNSFGILVYQKVTRESQGPVKSSSAAFMPGTAAAQ